MEIIFLVALLLSVFLFGTAKPAGCAQLILFFGVIGVFFVIGFLVSI